MQRDNLNALLAEIRAVREQTLTELIHVAEVDFATPTSMPRWDDVRRVLLRFGDHMREHANQIEDARQQSGSGPTMAQRMLAEGEAAWGKLLAATVGLDDEAAQRSPPGGGWSPNRVLEHVLETEQNYLNAVRAALAQRMVP